MKKIRLMKDEASARPEIAHINKVYAVTYEIKDGNLILDILAMLPGGDIGTSYKVTLDMPLTLERIASALQFGALRATSAYVEKMLMHASPDDQSTVSSVLKETTREVGALGDVYPFKDAAYDILIWANEKS